LPPASILRAAVFAPFLLLLFGASNAVAQPAPGGRHVHDGFYFRGSLGFAELAFEQRSDLGGIPNGHASGPGTASDLMLGGTPARGLVVGGALLATHSPNPQFDSRNPALKLDAAASFVVIGPFLDFFFDPRRGFHLGAAAGPSAIWYRDLDPDTADRPEAYAGFGVAGFAGYDAWISSNWSLGGYVRAMAAWTKRQVDYAGSPLVDERADGTSLAVLFSALYH